MFLACITLDLMDKERSHMSPEDCSLSHTKRAFEEPFKRVSSHTLCWALGEVPWIVQVSCPGVGLKKHLSVYLFINQVYSEPLLCAVNILSGGECFRLNTPEIDSKTKNCELCTKGLLGDILGRYSERRWRNQDWVGMERSRLQLDLLQAYQELWSWDNPSEVFRRNKEARPSYAHVTQSLVAWSLWEGCSQHGQSRGFFVA